MENLTNERTLEKDPQYFGAFLNMARHNVFAINNHLVEIMNTKSHKKKYASLKDEGDIPSCFICNVIKEKQNLFYTQLERFLPIVKFYNYEKLPINEKVGNEKEGIDYISLTNDLKMCFKELNDFRNDYTHYYNKVNGVNRKFKISENLAVFLRLNKQRAIEYTQKKFNGVFNIENYTLIKEREFVKDDNIITQDGLAFFICLFLEKEYAFQSINRIVGLKGTMNPNFMATREVLTAFCAKLPHEKFMSDNPEQSFVLEVLNELNKCPSILYNNITAKEKKQFQPKIEDKIQSIEENSLPDNLPEEKYEDYISDITSKTRKSDRFPNFALKYLDGKNDFELLFHLNLGKVLLNTYEKNVLGINEDRDIVEEAKIFGKLNDFEDKEDSIKKVDVRGNLLFELFHPAFHIANYKIGFIIKPLNETKSDYYITDYFKDKEDKWVQKFKYLNPDGFLSINELPKVILLELMQKGKVVEIVKSFLDKSEKLIFNVDFIEKIKSELAFNITFYRRFQNKKVRAYDNSKLKILSERKSKLNNVLKQYNLTDKQIPSRIVDYWLNIADVKDENIIANRIKAMKKDCKGRLKKLDNPKKVPKIGTMASYLAKDILNMIIDEKTKNKITAFYYDKIQECIALFQYSEKKKYLIDLFSKELKLFDKEKGHPFLSDLNIGNLNKTSEFYKEYLFKKGGVEKILDSKKGKFIEKDNSWIHKTFYTKVYNEKKEKDETKIKIPDDSTFIPFSIRNLAKEKSTLEKWLKNVKNGCREKDNPKPVDLPTNIFDDALIDILRCKLKEKNIPFKLEYKFSKLFELYCNDTQPFYNAEREYKVYDELVKFKPGSKTKYKEYFIDTLKKVFVEKKALREEDNKNGKKLPPIQKNDILNVFNDAITENEKTIRFYQTKDRIALEMVRKHIEYDKSIDIDLKELKLCNISTKLLDKTVNLKHTINGKLSYDENGQHINDKDKKPISKVICAERKIKDYTVFKKFVFDKRLPELFEYFKEDEIEYNKLKKELDEYNKYKEYVFDCVFKLEETIMNKPNALAELEEIIKKIIEEEKKKNPLKIINDKPVTHIQHKPYLIWLIKKDKIDENLKSFLDVIRNSFSHNQFPPKIIIKKFVELNKSESFSQKIYDKYEVEIKKIVSEVEKM
jgi:hypothetical protein